MLFTDLDTFTGNARLPSNLDAKAVSPDRLTATSDQILVLFADLDACTENIKPHWYLAGKRLSLEHSRPAQGQNLVLLVVFASPVHCRATMECTENIKPHWYLAGKRD